MSPKYVLLGDSNVRRNVNKTNKRSCPQLSSSTVLTCTDGSVFDEVLSDVKDDTTILLVACLTNFITAAPEDSSVAKRVEPILDGFVESLSGRWITCIFQQISCGGI